MAEQEIVDKHWFVMSATYGQELKIKAKLEELQIECFVPTKTTFSRERGKVVKKIAPAIKNLIFVYVDKPTIQRFKIKNKRLQYQTHYTDGKRVPIIVPEREMQNFFRAININEAKLVYLDQEIIELEKGAHVKIIGGEFDGIEGEFVRFLGKRNRSFVVKINGVLKVELKGITLKMMDGVS